MRTTGEIMSEGNGLNTPPPECNEDMLALGRLISYACQQAQALNLDLSRQMLDMALLAVMEDIQLSGITWELPSKPMSLELDSKVH